MRYLGSLTREERIANAEKAHAEGRIIQGQWRSVQEGRNLVCALAAFGPDIGGGTLYGKPAWGCPADLMPEWLASVIPAMDDAIRADQVPWFSGGIIQRAKLWDRLSDDAWERIKTNWLKCRRALGTMADIRHRKHTTATITRLFALIDEELELAGVSRETKETT